MPHPSSIKYKVLECYVDTDWAGSWNFPSSLNPISTRSRTYFVIIYAGCLILLKSKIQSLTVISTTEAEYITLSAALREVIGIICLLEDLQDNGLPILGTKPKICYRTFEDNKRTSRQIIAPVLVPNTSPFDSIISVHTLSTRFFLLNMSLQ